LKIPVDKLKELREQSGAGIMACRNAFINAEQDMEKALEILKEQNLYIAEKKKERATSQGIIEAYIHAGGRVGAMIELNCETDFAARTDEFKELAHLLAMQVTAQEPLFVSPDMIPEGTDLDIDNQEACLLLQPYIKDPGLTVQDVINEVIGKVGENIKVSRFARFELGEQ
jgi:elongation factor Ts